jgi:multidrug efflux pump
MKLNIFIRRPILATVISLIIILCGVVAAFNLPVSQFPNISPPSISIRAQFPGADAETSARVVAAQLENHLNGMSNLLYMATSTSSTGGVSINLTYEVGTDLNEAIDEVLNRIYAAMSLLPPVVQKLGVTARKSSPDQLMTVAFYADPYLDPKFVSNYLQRTVENDLLLLPTVGSISVYGTGVYAIRIWLDPNKMQYYGVGVSDIEAVIKDQNQEFIIGRANGPPFNNNGNKTMSINLKGGQMYSTPEQVANIILKNSGNQIVRIKDVARVELGANAYSTISEIDFRDKAGKFKFYPCSIMQVYLIPGANQLQAKQQILDRLEEDAKGFPYGIHYKITNDNSRFVEASVHNVVETLYIAFALVGLVILIFLQNWRASLIAVCTIPVSIIGTMAFLYLFGFSLNTLSLFALILAIGIVVDDAIVIIENIERLRSQYPDKKLSFIIELTLKEVMSAVIAIVLVLSVVFVPIMGLGGLSGIMYRQFAVTISCAVILSGISALTFTPALSNLILKHKVHAKTINRFDRLFMKITDYYVKIAKAIIIKPKIAVAIWFVVIAITIFLFKTVSTDFVPLEDQGIIMATINLPTSSSLHDTQNTVNGLMEKLTKNSNIASVLSVIGLDFLDSGGQKTYAASFYISLKEWSERHGKNSSADSIIKQVNKLNRGLTGVTVRAFNQPPMRGLSTTGGVEFYLEDRVVGNPHMLQNVADDLINRLKKHKEVANSYQTLDTNVLQISLLPNIATAKFYGVNLQNVYNAMQTMYSNNNINYVYIMQDLAWIIMEADYPFRATIDGLRNIYITNTRGNQVPIGSLIKVRESRNAPVVQRFNNFIATKIVVTPASGYTMGDVMQVISSELATIPKGYDYDWFGTSYQLKQSQKTSFTAFMAAFIMIYLVLAALFEMWRLPLVVLMGVPFALFGAAMILIISAKANDLYFQISLIALLGLSAKNIILLVQFALQHFNAGHSAEDSAIHALRERFRPIVMTSATFICGTLPLLFASGAGANAQHSVGLGIIGGIIGSVFLATLLTPAYFVLIMRGLQGKAEHLE